MQTTSVQPCTLDSLYGEGLSTIIETYTLQREGTTDDFIDDGVPRFEYLTAYRCDCGEQFDIGRTAGEDVYEQARACAWTAARGHIALTVAAYYTLYTGPGHAWLAVSTVEVEESGAKISDQSWIVDTIYYLEEDIEMIAFLEAKFGVPAPWRQIWQSCRTVWQEAPGYRK